MEQEQEEWFYQQWLEGIMSGGELGLDPVPFMTMRQDVFDDYFLSPLPTKEIAPGYRHTKTTRRKPQRTGLRERSNVPTARPSSIELLHLFEPEPTPPIHFLSNDRSANYEMEPLFPSLEGFSIESEPSEPEHPPALRKAAQCGHFLHPSLPEPLQVCPTCTALTKVAALGYREKEWEKSGGPNRYLTPGTSTEWKIARKKWHGMKAEVANCILFWEDMVKVEEQWDKEHWDDQRMVATKAERASKALRIMRKTIPHEQSSGIFEKKQPKKPTSKKHVQWDGNIRIIELHREKKLAVAVPPEDDDWDERYFTNNEGSH